MIVYMAKLGNKYLRKRSKIITVVDNVSDATTFHYEKSAQDCIKDAEKAGVIGGGWKTVHIEQEGKAGISQYMITDGRYYIGRDSDGEYSPYCSVADMTTFPSHDAACRRLKKTVKNYPSLRGYSCVPYDEHLINTRLEQLNATCATQPQHIGTVAGQQDEDGGQNIGPALQDGKASQEDGAKRIINVVKTTRQQSDGEVDEMLYSFIGRICDKKESLKRESCDVNKKLVDIYHFVEFSDFTKEDIDELYATYIMLKDALCQRRRIKDEMDKLEQMGMLHTEMTHMIHAFQQVKEEKYRPRIANEMFAMLVKKNTDDRNNKKLPKMYGNDVYGAANVKQELDKMADMASKKQHNGSRKNLIRGILPFGKR